MISKFRQTLAKLFQDLSQSVETKFKHIGGLQIVYILNPNEYSRVLPIVKNIDHNVALVFSVIEGNSPGTIYVDNITEPQSVFIATTVNCYYLCGREDNTEFNNEVKVIIWTESMSLARKLGFQDKADVLAHYWAENM